MDAKTAARNKRLNFWEGPLQLSMIRSYARRGCSLEEIAKKMGVSKPILVGWIKESPTLRDALTKSNVMITYCAEDMLEKKVREGEAWAIEMYLKAFKSSTYQPERWIGCEPMEDNNTDMLLEVLDIVDGVYGMEEQPIEETKPKKAGKKK